MANKKKRGKKGKAKKRAKPVSKKDVSHHLKKISHYIDKMSAKGYGKKYIQKELLAVGWPKELINEGLSKMRGEIKRIEMTPHLFGRLLFILIILMVIGVYVLLLFNEIFIEMINYVAYWSLYIILGLLVVSLIVLLRPLPIYEKIKNAYKERREIADERKRLKRKEKIRIALEKKRREAEKIRLKKEEKRKSKEERIKRILEEKRIKEEEKKRKILEKKVAKEERARLKKEEKIRRKAEKLKLKAGRGSIFSRLFRRGEGKKELLEKGKEDKLKLKEERRKREEEEKERRRAEKLKLKGERGGFFSRLFRRGEEKKELLEKGKEEKLKLKEEEKKKEEEKERRRAEKLKEAKPGIFSRLFGRKERVLEKIKRKEEKKKLKKENKRLKKEEKEVKKEEKLRLKEEKRQEKERRKAQKLRLKEEEKRKEEDEEKEEKKEKVHLVRVIPKALKIEIGKYDTDLDVLYKIIEKSGRIKLSAISRYFGVDQKKAEEWAKILQDHKLAEIHYPPVGEPELKKIRKPKKDIKIPKPSNP
jgi:hypothetical protein